MRVLLVSQYYAPEIGATQNRMRSFTEELTAAGHEVAVICEQPNHPHGVFQAGYGRRPLQRDRSGHLTVDRVWVAASPRKTTTRRLLFYGTFAAGAFTLTAMRPRYDVVLATSPPFPGALAVAAAARLRRTPFVIDVRDIWPAAAEALGEFSNDRAVKAFERAERWLYRHAAAVTATTKTFCRHVDSVAEGPVSTHLPNGALDDLVELHHAEPPTEGPFRIGYFGNFGIAQGLDSVLGAAKQLADEPIEFLLVGGGPKESELREEAARLGLSNVEFRRSVPTAEVGPLMLSCHALLVPLRDHPLLAGFFPSKLYDVMAVGRAAIVSAAGEAADFIGEHGFGVVIKPEDPVELATAARRLAADRDLAARLGAIGKPGSREYARSRQAAQLRQLLESIVDEAFAAPDTGTGRDQSCATADSPAPSGSSAATDLLVSD